ncbi:hypothetical protein BJX76DRAFT_346580 [Aspergillus varians]
MDRRIRDHLFPLHRVFGLTDDEWTSLRAYFTSFEALGVVVQREIWLRGESVRLKCILPDLAHAHADVVQERKKNKQACRQAVDKWKATRVGIKDTLIYRAMHDTSSLRNWWLTSWLRKQCAKSGGCYLDFGVWAGHCTPACPCCLDRICIDKPIEQLKSHGERRFDPRRGQIDRFTRKMLRAYSWLLWFP